MKSLLSMGRRMAALTAFVVWIHLPVLPAKAIDAGASSPSRLVIDMVHDNPGEPLQPTAFRDPARLAEWGYNGQVVVAAAEACQTYDKICPGLFPTNATARLWIEERAAALESKAHQIHAAGLKSYAWMQFVVLPRDLLLRFKDKLCDRRGRIDLERPMTREILRAQISELFDRCPDLDGIVVRTGEIYLHDTPYHTSKAGDREELMQGGTAILRGAQSHIALLQLLREEACVKRGKVVIYRTWDFGDNFHVNPKYYETVSRAVEPHTNLVFSIKHQAGDFLRMTPFNPTLGIGRHPQVVEVQCQREAYGKGAHPFYIGDGVINGWEEYATLMPAGQPGGLRDVVNGRLYAGVWTWSRGGGWEGPYITNELWCALNAYVISQYARNPARSELEIFNEFATRQLGLNDGDVARFRELNLLSASAVLRGQCSFKGPVDLWWARDHFMADPNLGFFVTNHLVDAVLAEKAEAVAQWKRIETLAQAIQFRDAETQEFVRTSCAYGRIKYAIFEQAWTILLLERQGAMTGHYDRERIAGAIAGYDRLWTEWRGLKAAHPSCATLYCDVAFGNHPGIGAAVNRCRGIASPVK